MNKRKRTAAIFTPTGTLKVKDSSGYLQLLRNWIFRRVHFQEEFDLNEHFCLDVPHVGVWYHWLWFFLGDSFGSYRKYSSYEDSFKSLFRGSRDRSQFRAIFCTLFLDSCWDSWNSWLFWSQSFLDSFTKSLLWQVLDPNVTIKSNVTVYSPMVTKDKEDTVSPTIQLRLCLIQIDVNRPVLEILFIFLIICEWDYFRYLNIVFEISSSLCLSPWR